MNLLEIYTNGAIFFVTFVSVFALLRVTSMDKEAGRPFTAVRFIVNVICAAIIGVFYGLLWPITLPRHIISYFK